MCRNYASQIISVQLCGAYRQPYIVQQGSMGQSEIVFRAWQGQK